MPRPCNCGKYAGPDRPWGPGNCVLCYLADNHPAYARQWGTSTASLPVVARPQGRDATALDPPCRHRGAEAGTEQCGPCGGNVRIKKFACALHGACHLTAKTLAGARSCHQCPDRDGGGGAAVAEAKRVHRVRMRMGGIGDAILGLSACAGLKRMRPDAEVVYVTHPHTVQWVLFFDGYDRLECDDGDGDLLLPVCGGYGERGGRCWERFAAVLGCEPVAPAPRAVSPRALEWAKPHAGCIAFAPWSTSEDRDWPLSHWLALEGMLLELGQRVVILDSHGSPGRADAFRGIKVLGEASNRVAALLAGAARLVVGDSGMAHVAGALGVPTLALCGPTGSRMIGFWSSIETLRAPDNDLTRLLPADVLGRIAHGNGQGTRAAAG